MLATAVCSVSMEPPSLLICVNRNASAYMALSGRGAFSVGILAAEDIHLGKHLGSAKGDERFSIGTWRTLADHSETLDGLPWLNEAQATVFCSTDLVSDYGSHTIFIGRVEGVVPALASNPLVYCDGQYRSLTGISA